MKQVISISLGASKDDYEFETEFLGRQFFVKRLGADGDMDRAAQMLLEWDRKADAIGIGNIKFPHAIASNFLTKKHDDKIKTLGKRIQTPVTTGASLRDVSFEWSLRYVDHKFGSYFNNAKVLFLSGMTSYKIARVMAEYTDNLTFADPVIENGISKLIHSIKGLERYAKGSHEILEWLPGKRLTSSVVPLKKWNNYILRKAMQKATIIVVPSYKFYEYLKDATLEELGGKTIITATAYDDRIEFLKERGVDVIIDTTPKILERVVAPNVIEALILAALEKKSDMVHADDLLEIISMQKMDPRVVYPSGREKRVNRFAFVIHPLSKEFLKKDKAVDFISSFTPPAFLDAVEKVIAYAPPWVYSKVTGIKSPTGAQAEGWLITVGGTPKQMLAHSPEFTYARLLQAARMARRMGAQIMGLGAFTKVVGDAGVTVAKKADIPITTGNSYSASGALWAGADAVRRMGLIQIESGKKIAAKTMVLGATGAIGSVCCRLLAKAFDEVIMAGRNTAKLLALQQSILEETPDVKIKITTKPDRFLEDMDVIVTATSGAGKKILDITKVKPGCVITDVARPLDLSPEDVAKRPDVLVIESGEIELPGNPEMKNIGLPHKVVYACLAETIVLALEGRFEIFTVGREIEWEKVREIYKLGLKHGMKLAAISGVNGVFSDADILKVRDLALKAGHKAGQPAVTGISAGGKA
ncbi:MAG: dehydrogenase [Proteobacteria bacterium]|nr:dehydrogenase [Pseudomonadota bacterium]MBU1581426.1 dehydrogenase [Pseudomonadota bacterium]MBU2454844.1 dehydrogenase [Pseudomonadota bacterium]MBU2631289.1 dehydrogenase [Pseudomonadota bacterium]